jgi:hypothetical protein
LKLFLKGHEMNNTNTGGPAFPVFPDTGSGHATAFKGMTLRDYFAAKAITGRTPGNLPGTTMAIAPEEYARWAYRMADAMLKVRNE